MGRVLVAVLACWLAAGAAAAPARAAEPDSSAAAWERGVVRERSWLGRTLHRFFGRAPRSGAELEGRAEQLVDRYAEFAGRRIEVVIVYPVLRFSGEPDDGDAVSWGSLMQLAAPLWSYTRGGIVRQYLLFGTGDRLDPFKLADSERMLRQLEYMNDVRILVLPIEDADDAVAVVVETRDRWPLGVTGNVVDGDRFDASAYWTNGFGVGLRLDNKVLVHRQREPEVGYRGYLAKQNLAGTFIDASLEYEDSWRELKRAAAVERRAVHPAVRWVGGLAWQRTDDRDNEGLPRGFGQAEVWTGRVFQLGLGDPIGAAARGGRRRTLTPAVSLGDISHRTRPTVTRDSLRGYHDRRTVLAGLLYENLTDYKTSYLFRTGETEDIPDGFVVKLSGGYEDGEFLRRTLGFAEIGIFDVSSGGQVAWLELGAGGYLRDSAFEDGLVRGRLGFVTPLLGEGRWRHRAYLQAAYLLGIDRTSGRGVVLGERSGIRDLPDDDVFGDQRLVLKLESRLFTPWRLFGFDTMLFTYADLGAAAGQHEPILGGRIYSSLGLGVRVSNPDLVLPTFELRCGAVRLADRRNLALAVAAGNLAYPEISTPGARPGTIPFR